VKLSIRFSALVLLFVFATGVFGAESPRTVVDLNPGWKFIKQDVPSAEQSSFDDASWQSINLPHTWNNLDGQDGGNNYYRGIGWYRLHLKADPAWQGKEIYLKFDAASVVSTVYVNGKQAGTHAGAFGAFCYDITPLADLKGDNVIAVKVSNAKDPNVAPLSGDFTVFGGIYRGVHLIVTNPLSISPIDDASSGVYIRQNSVDERLADLSVTTKLRFWDFIHGRLPSVQVKYELVDASGIVVQTLTQDVAFPKDKSDVVQEMKVPNPHLWNARKDPYLYTLRVSVLDGPVVSDIVEQPVGLRFFHVDPDKGFFLNGQPYRLVGVNRHQDHLDEGWAITLADHQLDFANIMEMGCTGVRLAHYQHAQEFYDLCDRGGIVAWAELPLVNSITESPEFEANAQQQLRELIKQSFNHPAICFWSLSNEQRGPGGKTAAQIKMSEDQVALLKKLNAEAHELDPTRLTTQATAIQPGKPQDDITDVIAFNRYFGWYGGKPTGLGADLDKIHKIYPNRGVGISEFGAGGAISQHEVNPRQPKPGGKWHPEEWQCEVHEAAWAAIKPRTWLWGTFIWAEHDFAADQRDEGEHAGRNDKGMVTYDGKTKKDVFYFYKANWSTEPMVYITQRRFTPRPVADAPVKIYSNCDSVELSLNGKSLGTTPGSDIKVFIWDKVQLQPGENKLVATGMRDGKTYIDACTIVYDVNATDGHPPVTQPVK
jgi:beta-galactosidase